MNIVCRGFGFERRDREIAACGRAEASGSPSSEPLPELGTLAERPVTSKSQGVDGPVGCSCRKSVAEVGDDTSVSVGSGRRKARQPAAIGRVGYHSSMTRNGRFRAALNRV